MPLNLKAEMLRKAREYGDQPFGLVDETPGIGYWTVRTIQRVEKAEPSSIDTKRALARAFEIEDIDAFNKGHSFKTADQMNLHHMTIPDDIAIDAAKDLAGLYDNMRDYCDVSDHYGYTQKVEFYDFLDGLVATIRGHGLSICYGIRRTKLTNDSWLDKTPWPVTIAYVFAVPVGAESKNVAVPKAISPTF